VTPIPANSIFYPLLDQSALHNGLMQPCEVEISPVLTIQILMIQQHDQVHLIENKCGHFGVKLHTGKITPNSITCSVHGFCFDLHTGQPLNREWENCDPIKVFQAYWQADSVGIAVVDNAPLEKNRLETPTQPE